MMYFLQLCFQVSQVAISVAEAPGLTESDAVNDACVVQGVADNCVFGVEKGFKQSGVGIETG